MASVDTPHDDDVTDTLEAGTVVYNTTTSQNETVVSTSPSGNLTETVTQSGFDEVYNTTQLTSARPLTDLEQAAENAVSMPRDGGSFSVAWPAEGSTVYVGAVMYEVVSRTSDTATIKVPGSNDMQTVPLSQLSRAPIEYADDYTSFYIAGAVAVLILWKYK